MIRLRPFKPSDSEVICKWFGDEKAFRKWCIDKFDFPLTARQICDRNDEFQKCNDAWYMTAVDESGEVCGSFIFRKADFINNSIHMGFIVISPEHRGRGLGSQMMKTALTYADKILGMKRVTLGVFENNPAAVNCYKSAGFKAQKFVENAFEYKDEKWNLFDMAWEKK